MRRIWLLFLSSSASTAIYFIALKRLPNWHQGESLIWPLWFLTLAFCLATLHIALKALRAEFRKLMSNGAISRSLGEHAFGDTIEEFELRATSDPLLARLWLVRQLVGSLIVIHIFDQIRKAVTARRSA